MICKYHDEFDSDCHRCCRQKRFEKVKNNKPQPFYVIMYGISRHYGGPEEGGWWFDWQTVIDSEKVWSIYKALEIIRLWKEENPQPKHNRFSVLGGEDIVIQILASLDFVRETTRRPHYE